jgi:hypothetical protein
MNEATGGPKQQQTWWRFSLRELLLFMLAAAAFLGWGGLLYEQFRTFGPTPFFENNETWQQDVRAIYEELGEAGAGQASGSSTKTQGTSAVSRTMVYRMPLAPAKRTLFLDAFEARVRTKLAAEGCRIGGGGSGNGRNENRILMYDRGPVGGVFEIWVTDVGNGEMGVMVEMREARGRFQTLQIIGN